MLHVVSLLCFQVDHRPDSKVQWGLCYDPPGLTLKADFLLALLIKMVHLKEVILNVHLVRLDLVVPEMKDLVVKDGWVEIVGALEIMVQGCDSVENLIREKSSLIEVAMS